MISCPTPDKSKHRDKASAYIEIRRKSGTSIRPYRCVCGMWHVGHTSPHLKKRAE